MKFRYLTNIIMRSLLAIFAMVAVAGCQDDLFDDPMRPTGEGTAVIEASVDFRPMAGALSRSAGNSISSIDKIWVLLYTTEGNLAFSTQLNRDDVTISNQNRTDADTGTDFNRAEDKTERATFRLAVPYGNYRMYAVANVGNIDEYSNEIASESGLKAIRFKWNNEDVTKNAQMFGYFTNDGENWTGAEAPNVRIDQSTTKLKAWIKRVASKVTVAYDGSKLRKGVEIYIKSVTIKDIPYSSQLGEGNAVKDTDAVKYAEAHASQTIVYGEGPQETAETNWPCITKENPYGKPQVGSDHSAGADALFFFENMQGTGQDKEKWQDADGDGKVDFPGANDPESDDFKDNKDGRSLGTYIEVEAYYKAALFDNTGKGRIVYRFMLGKDVSKDYNAERNHHYKLTLCFNGNANDVDWHIDYERDPGLYFPVPYYISYIYNEEMIFPLTIVGDITGPVRAEISSEDEENLNSWAPFDAGADYDYYRGTVANRGPWNGFLALRYTDDHVVTGEAFNTANTGQRLYWEEKNEGWREYLTVPSDTPYEDGSLEGSYTVTKEGNETTIHLPLYTRAKQLVKTSAYTGNNIFTAYRRKAIVTFTATINGKECKAKATVIQVERVANPKGVWRSSGNTDDFFVELKIRHNESDVNFTNLESEGPWTATLINGENDFEISKDGSTYGAAPVTGLTNSFVRFHVRPKRKIGANEVKCGLVKVTYHDNSCVHYIMLRQGFSPLDVNDTGIAWHSYNMYDKNTETLSPLEEGSMFKFGNFDDAILAENNKTFGYGVPPGNNKFKLAGGGEKTWSQIQPCGARIKAATIQGGTYPAPTNLGAKVRVARFYDFADIYNDNNMAYGYGVLYGDGATKTANTNEEAYGYYRNGTSTSSTYGMRGCFVYNQTDGRNIFFPIGATGYGHRKSNYDENFDAGYGGVLRYAGRSAVMTSYNNNLIEYRPLFYDIYLAQGAIYFLETAEENTQLAQDSAPRTTTAWDVNYHTFEFYSYGIDATARGGGYGNQKNTNAIYGSDAAFVRCVTDNR